MPPTSPLHPTSRPLVATTPTRAFAVHHSLNGVFARREAPWKFVPSRGSGGFSNPKQITPAAGESSAQLYNLATDPHETRNLAATEPATVTRLAQRLAKIQSRINHRRTSNA